jgi:hypothetical protein
MSGAGSAVGRSLHRAFVKGGFSMAHFKRCVVIIALLFPRQSLAAPATLQSSIASDSGIVGSGATDKATELNASNPLSKPIGSDFSHLSAIGESGTPLVNPNGDDQGIIDGCSPDAVVPLPEIGGPGGEQGVSSTDAEELPVADRILSFERSMEILRATCQVGALPADAQVVRIALDDQSFAVRDPSFRNFQRAIIQYLQAESPLTWPSDFGPEDPNERAAIVASQLHNLFTLLNSIDYRASSEVVSRVALLRTTANNTALPLVQVLSTVAQLPADVASQSLAQMQPFTAITRELGTVFHGLAGEASADIVLLMARLGGMPLGSSDDNPLVEPVERFVESFVDAEGWGCQAMSWDADGTSSLSIQLTCTPTAPVRNRFPGMPVSIRFSLRVNNNGGIRTHVRIAQGWSENGQWFSRRTLNLSELGVSYCRVMLYAVSKRFILPERLPGCQEVLCGGPSSTLPSISFGTERAVGGNPAPANAFSQRIGAIDVPLAFLVPIPGGQGYPITLRTIYLPATGTALSQYALEDAIDVTVQEWLAP